VLVGESDNPRCFSFPSQAASPKQISRSEWARPSWQYIMAMNCAQQEKPRECRSALCFVTKL